MAKEIKQRTVIFFYPNEKYFRHHYKHCWMTDREWEKFRFIKFDANNRDYIYINDCTILVECGKAL